MKIGCQRFTKEAVKLIYKLVQMNSLAVYWNADTKLISDLGSKAEIKDAMRAAIATKDKNPAGYNFSRGHEQKCVVNNNIHFSIGADFGRCATSTEPETRSGRD